MTRAGNGRSTAWLWSIALVVAVCGIICFAVLYSDHVRTQRYFRASVRFRQFGELVQQMILEQPEGVAVDSNGRPFIKSFDALFAYVAAKQANTVDRPDSSNPFPGLLPEARYLHRRGDASSADDLLFWSETVHHKNVGDIQFRISAGGRVDSLSDAGTMPPQDP